MSREDRPLAKRMRENVSTAVPEILRALVALSVFFVVAGLWVVPPGMLAAAIPTEQGLKIVNALAGLIFWVLWSIPYLTILNWAIENWADLLLDFLDGK